MSVCVTGRGGGGRGDHLGSKVQLITGGGRGGRGGGGYSSPESGCKGQSLGVQLLHGRVELRELVVASLEVGVHLLPREGQATQSDCYTD